MVPFDAFFSGSTATLIVAVGYLTAIGCMIRGQQTHSNLQFWAGGFLACGGSFYLGTMCSFFNLLVSGHNLSGPLVGQLCYTWAPLGAAISMYVGLSMIKPKLAKPVALIFLATAPFYWYGLWIVPELTIGYVIPMEGGEGLIDINLLSFIQLMTAGYLASFALILISGFSWLALHSSGIIKSKARLHALGYTLFVVCGAIDALFAFSTFIVFVRFFMALSFILLHRSFTSEETKV